MPTRVLAHSDVGEHDLFRVGAGIAHRQHEMLDDTFDDGSSMLVSNAHLEQMKATCLQYGEQLRKIEYALTQSLTEHWDPNRAFAAAAAVLPLTRARAAPRRAGATVDPIEIETEPYEQTNILELIQTDNQLFNKVMKVFAWLCDESLLLESIVRHPPPPPPPPPPPT